jgi:hypothetical protein
VYLEGRDLVLDAVVSLYLVILFVVEVPSKKTKNVETVVEGNGNYISLSEEVKVRWPARRTLQDGKV